MNDTPDNKVEDNDSDEPARVMRLAGETIEALTQAGVPVMMCLCLDLGRPEHRALVSPTVLEASDKTLEESGKTGIFLSVVNSNLSRLPDMDKESAIHFHDLVAHEIEKRRKALVPTIEEGGSPQEG